MCTKVFDSGCIHGFREVPHSDTTSYKFPIVAVFGQKKIQVIEINLLHSAKHNAFRVLCYFPPFSDWILDICWLQLRTSSINVTHYGEEDIIMDAKQLPILSVAFAHNYVEFINFENEVCACA